MCEVCVVEYDKEADPEKKKRIGNLVECPECGARMIIQNYGYPNPGLASCDFACCIKYFCPAHSHIKNIPCEFMKLAS